METKKKREVKSKPETNGDYPLAPKDKTWLDGRLRAYNQLIGKSIDAETISLVKKRNGRQH